MHRLRRLSHALFAAWLTIFGPEWTGSPPLIYCGKFGDGSL